MSHQRGDSGGSVTHIPLPIMNKAAHSGFGFCIDFIFLAPAGSATVRPLIPLFLTSDPAGARNMKSMQLPLAAMLL